MGRLTKNIDYCTKYCDFGKRGHCFFKDKSKCYENNMFEKLRAYEEICEDLEKIKEIDGLYLEKCEEVNFLKSKLEEYENLGLEAIYGLMSEVTRC